MVDTRRGRGWWLRDGLRGRVGGWAEGVGAGSVVCERVRVYQRSAGWMKEGGCVGGRRRCQWKEGKTLVDGRRGRGWWMDGGGGGYTMYGWVGGVVRLHQRPAGGVSEACVRGLRWCTVPSPERRCRRRSTCRVGVQLAPTQPSRGHTSAHVSTLRKQGLFNRHRSSHAPCCSSLVS